MVVIAKVAMRGGTRFFGRHAALQILVNQELKMGVHLLLQFAGEMPPSFETRVPASTTIGA